jgi:N-dimethylarginine dimethylaminohydrolase
MVTRLNDESQSAVPKNRHFTRRNEKVANRATRRLLSKFMVKSALMCPPTFFDVRETKNPYMGAPIDHGRAQQQWENLRQALQESGLTVELIDPVKDLDDMVFAANQVFVGQHPNLGKFIVPSRMRYASRQKEVAFYVEWFRRRGYKVIDLDLGEEYLEGHGDLIWHPDGSRVWAAYGFRSSRGGVDKFAAEMSKLSIPVTTLELVDHHCYHLDTCLCPLNKDAVLIYPGALAPAALDAVHKGFRRVHSLSRDEAVKFIGNGIVANGRYLTPRATPNLARILAEEGLTPVIVDTSEFEKSGGSVFCMKTFID